MCELDIIFNCHKAYYILDEILLGGRLLETSKREVLRVIAAQDDLLEEDLKKESTINKIRLKV